MKKWKTTHNYEVEVNDHVYKVEATFSFWRDNDYGADADGNRGVPRTEVDDLVEFDVLEKDGQVKLLFTNEERSEVEKALSAIEPIF